MHVVEEDPIDPIIEKVKQRLKNIFTAGNVLGIILFIVGLGLSRYSAIHLTNGGICGILMIMHGVPFLVSWVLCWAVWKSQSVNWRTKGLLWLSIVLNALVIILMWDLGEDDLYWPSFVLLVAQGIVLARFIVGFKKPD